MSEPLLASLEPLSRVPGVHGALVVDAETALPVVAELAEGVSETALAALTASLYRRAVDGAAGAGFGQANVLELEAEEGNVLVAGSGELLVIVLTEPDAQLGRVRLETKRTLGRIG